IQNDVSVISGVNDGFGYRSDDHGDTIGAATAMEVDGSTATESGIITQISDKDYFSFSTLTGTVSFTVSPAQFGGMLDSTVKLVNGSGTVLTTADTSSLGETVSANVSAGQFFLLVQSKGNAGDIGQYS